MHAHTKHIFRRCRYERFLRFVVRNPALRTQRHISTFSQQLLDQLVLHEAIQAESHLAKSPADRRKQDRYFPAPKVKASFLDEAGVDQQEWLTRGVIATLEARGGGGGPVEYLPVDLQREAHDKDVRGVLCGWRDNQLAKYARCDVVTESRINTRFGTFLLRAHPDYRSSDSPWNDFAYIKWDQKGRGGDGGACVFPVFIH